MQRVRLKNIHLATALKKLESTIRNKEELAGMGAASIKRPHVCWLLHNAICMHCSAIGRRQLDALLLGALPGC